MRDETAFTDAIYRTNQAFEGSLKEAYRVLAGKDPNEVRPCDIEKYLKGKLRPRVLDQFKNYRTEWRNPSAHDYSIDFDEDEALLAIVTVYAFAIVLIDQIAEKLSYEKTHAAAEANPPTTGTGPLLRRTVQLLTQFASLPGTFGPREAELEGAIAGFLSAAMPKASVMTGVRLGNSNRRSEADILIEEAQHKLLVEVKRIKPTLSEIGRVAERVIWLMSIGAIRDAVVYFAPGNGTAKMSAQDLKTPSGGCMVVLIPEAKNAEEKTTQ